MKYIGEAKYQYHNSILIMKYSGEITQASCGTLLSLPAKDAIHWALLSLLISSSIRIATVLLAAASFAAGVISPTLASKHIA